MMSLRTPSKLFLIAVAVMAAISCKKDSTTETSPSLYGLTFDCPLFVSPDQKVSLTPKGVEHPEGKEIGYYWKVTPTMSKIDTTRYENGLDKNGNKTDGTLNFTFSDTLGTYNVLCYAFASGYIGDSHQISVEVVEGGLNKSIKNTGIMSIDPKITYDGIDYYYVEKAGLHWFRNNLAYDAMGAPYAGCEAMSDVFGRYYSYEEAMTACPEGWRLPTDREWVALCNELGAEPSAEFGIVSDVAAKLFANASFNDYKMLEYWPNVGDITNESKISLIPAGFANLGEKTDGKYNFPVFDGSTDYAVVWTSDKDEDGMAYYRYLVGNQPDFFIAKGDALSFGASVRCVRDAD